MKHWFTIVNFPTIYQPTILSTETPLRQFLKVCPASPNLDLGNSLRYELILLWFNLQMMTLFFKVSLRQFSKVCQASSGLDLKKQSSLAWFYKLIFPCDLKHNQKPELLISGFSLLNLIINLLSQFFQKLWGGRVRESQKT